MDVNKREVFSRVSSLVGSGQHKIAIDLLLEYLKVEPNSSIILSLLDRAYTLDNQPDNAAIYQARSLETKEAQHTNKNNSIRYKFDDYSDDDMAFTKSQIENSYEEDYIFDVDGTSQPPVIKSTKIDQSNKPILSNETSELNEFESNITVDGKSRHNNTISAAKGSIITEEDGLPHPNNSFFEITAADLTLDNGSAKQPSINVNNNSDWVEPDDFDLIEKEALLSDELFGYNYDNQDEEIHDEFVHLSLYSPEEETSEDLTWDDFDGLDDFDEFAHREVEEEAQSDEKISREIRARQIAVEVLEQSGWNHKYLSLLQKIFIENGWSATRIAIEREIDKNLQPEELALARKIRLLWFGSERYWMTFQKIKHNAPFQQTEATYKHMSWPESLRVIRCFPSLPDIEEIYLFIDETFEDWYNSNRLRRSFKIFFKFLKYRIGSMNRSLPGNCMFSFINPEHIDAGVDSNMFCNTITPESQGLIELGFQLNQWPRPPENKIKIIKEAK